MNIHFKSSLLNFTYAALMITALASLGACKKMDSTYKAILESGTRTYPGKADSVKSYPGSDRLKLSFLLTSDPKIVRSVIYWNSGRDSVTIPITRTANVDTITRTLTKAANGIVEGTYIFSIYTYDKSGNKSIQVDKQANVYGAKYQASLLTRPIQTTVRTTNTLVIDWYNAGDGFAGVELTYTNTASLTKIIIIPATQTETTITDFKPNTTFRYRTIYMPEPLAIDQFYTDYTDVPIK
jgi:hypothetical protein